jgi:ribosomal protein L37AE/L43A
MSHRVPTGKANIVVFKQEVKSKRYKLICPKCDRDHIKKTANGDLYCQDCMTIFTHGGSIVDA